MRMKLILSRKGFDSTYGGYPSPILPDGTLLSLPIPNRRFIRLDKQPLYFNGDSSFPTKYKDLQIPQSTNIFYFFYKISSKFEYL